MAPSQKTTEPTPEIATEITTEYAATRLARRVASLIEGHSREDFEALALEVFLFQYGRVGPYRRLCDARDFTPVTLDPGIREIWRRVPAVPVVAFRSLALHAAPPLETFRSSGTTAGTRSVHHHPFPELYRQTIDVSFPRFCLPGGAPRPILSLVPTREQAPDSSLAFMAEHVLARWGEEGSAVAFGAHGVATSAADDWARARCAEGRAGLVFATAFALVQWLEALEARGRRWPLPAGTVVFETGGFKGRVREIARPELLARLEASLDVPPGQVVREYGMTELTSQLYTRVLEGGDPDLFFAPPWVRVRVLEPSTLAEQPAGEPGILAIFDLANLGSAAHLLTQDLGVAEGDGFRLLGRASDADLRGCSLTVEALEGGHASHR